MRAGLHGRMERDPRILAPGPIVHKCCFLGNGCTVEQPVQCPGTWVQEGLVSEGRLPNREVLHAGVQAVHVHGASAMLPDRVLHGLQGSLLHDAGSRKSSA